MGITEIYNKYYVCDTHFSPNYRVRGTRRGLTINAVPSINIPGFFEEVVEIAVTEPIPGPSTSHIGTLIEESRQCEIPKPISEVCKETSMNRALQSVETSEIETHGGTKAEFGSFVEFVSHQDRQEEVSDKPVEGYTHERQQRKPEKLRKDSTPTSRGVQRKTNLLREVNVTRSVDLTPKAKSFYKKLTVWSRRMGVMHKKITNYRTRLTSCKMKY